MNEILDDPDYDGNNIGTVDKLVIRNSIMATVIFIGIHYLREFVPANLIEREGTEIKTIGLLIIIAMIIVVRYTVDSIYAINESKKAIFLAMLGGSTIFYAYVLFLLILNVIILGYGMEIDLISILSRALFLSLFGFFYGYIRAAKITGEKRTIPILLLFGFFTLIGALQHFGILN